MYKAANYFIKMDDVKVSLIHTLFVKLTLASMEVALFKYGPLFESTPLQFANKD